MLREKDSDGTDVLLDISWKGKKGGGGAQLQYENNFILWSLEFPNRYRYIIGKVISFYISVMQGESHVISYFLVFQTLAGRHCQVAFLCPGGNNQNHGPHIYGHWTMDMIKIEKVSWKSPSLKRNCTTEAIFHNWERSHSTPVHLSMLSLPISYWRRFVRYFRFYVWPWRYHLKIAAGQKYPEKARYWRSVSVPSYAVSDK